MIKASQSAVIQATNVNLVNIREAEINYLSQFFTSFATQSALITGFTLNGLTQAPGLQATCNVFFVHLYWVTSAIAFTSSVHVLVCCILLSVYGQGLALRGPLGSMVKAVDGMLIEMKQVLAAFIICIVSFAFNLIGLFWIMMNTNGAIVSSLIILLGLWLWYHYTLKIYNRFKYKSDTSWEENAEVDNPLQSQPNPLPGPSQTNDEKSKSSGGGFFGFRSKKQEKVEDDNFGPEKLQTPLMDSSPMSHEGYLTMRVKTTSKDTRERRYIVVRGGRAYYYKDKSAYIEKPKEPLKKRPTELEDYTLSIEAESFRMLLSPVDQDDDRQVLEFACDNPAELAVWAEVISRSAARTI